MGSMLPYIAAPWILWDIKSWECYGNELELNWNFWEWFLEIRHGNHRNSEFSGNGMEMVRFAANLLEICWGNNKINTELNISKITNYRAWRRWVNPWEIKGNGTSHRFTIDFPPKKLVEPSWKIWVRQWEGLSHILWKIKNVPNHQPENLSIAMFDYWRLCLQT